VIHYVPGVRGLTAIQDSLRKGAMLTDVVGLAILPQYCYIKEI